jgi:hypothetical protein
MARDVRAAAEASEGRAIMAKGDWGLLVALWVERTRGTVGWSKRIGRKYIFGIFKKLKFNA